MTDSYMEKLEALVKDMMKVAAVHGATFQIQKGLRFASEGAQETPNTIGITPTGAGVYAKITKTLTDVTVFLHAAPAFSNEELGTGLVHYEGSLITVSRPCWPSDVANAINYDWSVEPEGIPLRSNCAKTWCDPEGELQNGTTASLAHAVSESGGELVFPPEFDLSAPKKLDGSPASYKDWFNKESPT